jgi:hypothetical protein
LGSPFIIQPIRSLQLQKLFFHLLPHWNHQSLVFCSLYISQAAKICRLGMLLKSETAGLLLVKQKSLCTVGCIIALCCSRMIAFLANGCLCFKACFHVFINILIAVEAHNGKTLYGWKWLPLWTTSIYGRRKEKSFWF